MYDILITKCSNLISLAFLAYYLLQSAKKLLQSASGITKCDIYYKVVRNLFISVSNIHVTTIEM